jgi:hypothetical protein
MLFSLVVLTPLFRGTFPAHEEVQVAYAAGRRYHFVTARAMELVLLTGVVVLVIRLWNGAEGPAPRYWVILGLKGVGFLLMAGLETWQRISLHRRLAPLLIAGGGGVLGEQQWRAIQSQRARLMRLNLGVGVATVFLGLLLRGS